MTNLLDRNIATPLYLQLENILREEISSGKWKSGQRFYSERELDEKYGLSRMTVRAVVNQLVADGLLYRVQGKGTFISQPKISTLSPGQMGIRRQLESKGYDTSIMLSQEERIMPPEKVRAILQLQPDEDVYIISRTRMIGQEPISIHTSYVPCRLAPDLLNYLSTAVSLSNTLEKYFGLRMAHLEETLESVSATQAEAQTLHVKKGYSLILLEDIVYNENRTPYEFAKILFRGDKIKLSFEYHH